MEAQEQTQARKRNKHRSKITIKALASCLLEHKCMKQHTPKSVSLIAMIEA
jgi:hypothetical protein